MKFNDFLFVDMGVKIWKCHIILLPDISEMKLVSHFARGCLQEAANFVKFWHIDKIKFPNMGAHGGRTSKTLFLIQLSFFLK